MNYGVEDAAVEQQENQNENEKNSMKILELFSDNPKISIPNTIQLIK